MEKEKEKAKYTPLLPLLFAVALFVAASYLVQEHAEAVAFAVRSGGFASILIYIGLGVLAVVVPPASNLFLVPVGTAAWGPFATAMLNIAGWWLGALIAFHLARKYGAYLSQKFPSLARVPHVEALISKHHPFWSLVFLRMTVPVDVLSYAVGFFTTVGAPLYAASTLVGIVPFAFLFAYASLLPAEVLTTALVTGALLFLLYAAFRLKNPEGLDSKR